MLLPTGTGTGTGAATANWGHTGLCRRHCRTLRTSVAIWDREHRRFAAKLLPGEYYVTTAGEQIATVLGSCVSACVRDRRLGIGGMNHFMLPLDASKGASSWGTAVSAATRYGNEAMERLINDILKLGGRRDSLEVKLVGGGKVLAGIAIDIGARNIEFVRKYVADEGFSVAGQDLGDIYPRKVHYSPDTGKLRVQEAHCSAQQDLVRARASLPRSS